MSFIQQESDLNSANTQREVEKEKDFLKDLTLTRRQEVWAIGGGKGGVGKSLITANLSICLSMMGKKVVSVDLDLGGANLHTCLGVPIPDKTLSDYFNKSVPQLSDLVTPTGLPNLSIISGAQDDLGMANLKSIHNSKIISSVAKLDADFVLFDLGAGTQTNTLDFFINADQGILAVLPEPTSIENTYRFIKAVFYQRLKAIEELLDIRPLIENAMNSKLQNHGGAPIDLINRVVELDPIRGLKLKNEIAKFCPKLIMNQVRTQSDIDLGFSMKMVCKKYFGIDIDYIGYLEYDTTVWQSVKRRRPLLVEFPHSKLMTSFDKIIHKLINKTKV